MAAITEGPKCHCRSTVTVDAGHEQSSMVLEATGESMYVSIPDPYLCTFHCALWFVQIYCLAVFTPDYLLERSNSSGDEKQ